MINDWTLYMSDIKPSVSFFVRLLLPSGPDKSAATEASALISLSAAIFIIILLWLQKLLPAFITTKGRWLVPQYYDLLKMIQFGIFKVGEQDFRLEILVKFRRRGPWLEGPLSGCLRAALWQKNCNMFNQKSTFWHNIKCYSCKTLCQPCCLDVSWLRNWVFIMKCDFLLFWKKALDGNFLHVRK